MQLTVSKKLFSKYRSVRAAIEAAQPGSTIYVEEGTYEEGPIYIDKPLQLIGVGSKEQVSIISQQATTVLIQDTSAVKISNLMLTLEGNDEVKQEASLMVKNSTGIELQDCLVQASAAATYVAKGEKTAVKVTTSSFLGHCKVNVFIADGAYTEFSHCVIDNGDYSVLVEGQSCAVINHTQFHNAHQAYIQTVNEGKVQLLENTFTGNAFYGLDLKAPDNTVSQCQFHDLNIAINLEGAHRTLIQQCTFVDNKTAINGSHSEDVRITGSLFERNVSTALLLSDMDNCMCDNIVITDSYMAVVVEVGALQVHESTISSNEEALIAMGAASIQLQNCTLNNNKCVHPEISSGLLAFKNTTIDEQLVDAKIF